MNATLILDNSTAKAMRRTSAVAIVHSGGKQTIYGCLCGARHSCATDYRRAKHVSDFICDHESSCGHLFAAMNAMRQPEWLDSSRDAIYSDDSH